MGPHRSLGRILVALGATLGLAAVIAPPVGADPVTISLAGKAKQKGSISYKLEGSSIPELVIDAKKDQTAKDALDDAKKGLDGDIGGSYAITRATKVVGGMTVETLTLTPKAGVKNFTKATQNPDSVDDPDPGYAPASVKVAATSPGVSDLAFAAGGQGDPAARLDWTLLVLDQTDAVTAMSVVAGLPNAAPAPDLIALFAADLRSQGVPVADLGGTLRLATPDNRYFAILRPEGSILQPILSNAVPEPASLVLVALGGLGLVAGARRAGGEIAGGQPTGPADCRRPTGLSTDS